jgi:catechol 2,3-dioxygenase-like lactoylglutathione lyase family enzyme
MPSQRLAQTTLLVPDYDEAIAFFTQALRWRLLEDTALGRTKRWVVVSPGGADDAGGALLLAQPGNAQEAAQIGRQAAGRVGHFLHTTDFAGDLAHMRQHAVRFLEAPRHEAYGSVVVFQDPWGNRWDLIQPTASAASPVT